MFSGPLNCILASHPLRLTELGGFLEIPSPTYSVVAPQPQAPSSSNSGSRHPNSSAKNKRGKAEEPPASDAARDVGKRLGISGAIRAGGSRRRVPVTVCVNDVSRLESRDGVAINTI